MDIPVMSISMNQAKVRQEVGMSVLKMAMDTAKSESVDIAKLMDELTIDMERIALPHLASNVDIRG